MGLPEDRVVAFLQYPSTNLVDLAVSLANLTDHEETAINLCGRKKITQEKAAEKTGYSVDSMQKWYRSGIRKLSEAWAESPWIWKLTEK